MAALLDDPLALTLARLDQLGVRGPQDDFYVVDPTALTDPGAVLDHLAREAAVLKPVLVVLDALYLSPAGWQQRRERCGQHAAGHGAA